jgi:GAF domain-containing protein
MSTEEFSDALVAVNRAMTQSESLEHTLQRIATIANSFIPHCESVGVTMRTDNHPETVAYDGDHASALDNAQYEDDLGPCLQAYRENEVVVVDRIAEMKDEWPTFTRRAEDLGVLSSLSLPLHLDDRTVGAMNLYATQERAFPRDVQKLAALFSAQAAVAIVNASVYWRTFELTANLERALDSRDIIGQAKGILMAQLRITGEEAFDLLREASQRRNVKLREIADEVARTGEPPSV